MKLHPELAALYEEACAKKHWLVMSYRFPKAAAISWHSPEEFLNFLAEDPVKTPEANGTYELWWSVRNPAVRLVELEEELLRKQEEVERFKTRLSR